MANHTKQRRYPGVVPFQANQSHLFFGRDEDIEDLYDLILMEKMVVLFGKSGYGKSSLLNAGVLPRFAAAKRQTDRFSVVQIRFTAWSEGSSQSPLEALRRVMGAKDAHDPPTLWEIFRQQDQENEGRFLLVFDQFEELFTYPPEEQRAFRWQLAELLFSTLPQSVRDRMDALPEAERQRFAKPLYVKAVFSIRADRMSLLDGLKDALPTILHRRYELTALNRQQARAALTEPALQTGDFASPPFTWSEDTITRILDTFSRDKQGREVGVESFLLQVLAQNVETRVLNGTIKDRDGDGTPDVHPDDLPTDLSNIFSEYYQNKLDELPLDERQPACLLIEDGLLFATNDSDARRLSMDADVLMQRFGATPMLLKALENTFLVRREANTTGGYNYEISHDTLLAPVSVARKARLTEAAARQHAAEEAAERERLREQAAERERQLEEERRKRRRASLIAFGGLALALLACGASVFAYMKQSEAKEALIKVESATIAVTRGLLERAKEDVYHLNYEKARTAVLEAASLGQQKTDVAYALMELAYFQAEAAQWDKAVPDALQVATLLGNKTAQQHIATLPSDTMQWREHLRMALRDCSASVFESLEKRYYPTMRPVPAGKFMMGGNLEYIFYVDGGESLRIDYGLFFPGENEPVFNNSLPIHEVALSAFNMSETEITFFQWNLYLTSEKGDSTIYEWAPDWGLDGDNPAVNISWIDAASYANWLSERHGKSPVYDIHFKNRVTHSDGSMSATAVSGESPIATMYPNTNGYQMPTEAQWEYAAKNAGRDTFEYAGGNDIDGVAWSAGTMEGNKGTQPVATKQPNALGLYDMSGNAWEWCFDYFQEAYPSEAQTNPTGPQDGYRRVCRGGSWGSDPQFCRTACRYGGSPRHMDRSKGLGFRLVLP